MATIDQKMNFHDRISSIRNELLYDLWDWNTVFNELDPDIKKAFCKAIDELNIVSDNIL